MVAAAGGGRLPKVVGGCGWHWWLVQRLLELLAVAQGRIEHGG